MAIAATSQPAFGTSGLSASWGISSESNGPRRRRNSVNPSLGSDSGAVQFLDPAHDRDWDELASSHSGYSVFHSSAWARVLMNTYGHKSFYIHLSDRRRTAALLPLMEVASPLTGRRGVSLPFSDFCGALTFDPASDELLA